MKTITIRVSDDKQSDALMQMLQSMNFIDSIDMYEDDATLTSEEISMVEERLEHYKKNPESAKDWKEVRQMISKKYGL